MRTNMCNSRRTDVYYEWHDPKGTPAVELALQKDISLGKVRDTICL